VKEDFDIIVELEGLAVQLSAEHGKCQVETITINPRGEQYYGANCRTCGCVGRKH